MYRLDWKAGDMSGTVENLESEHKAMAMMQDLRWLLRLDEPLVYEVTEQPTKDEATAASLGAYCDYGDDDVEVGDRVDKAGGVGWWVHARLFVYNFNNEGE